MVIVGGSDFNLCSCDHTAIFANRKVRYMYICFIFSPVFLNPPCRMLEFQCVTRISLVQTINCTLRHGLNSFEKDCFSDFCTCWRLQKDYNPCLMTTALYYLSSKLDSSRMSQYNNPRQHY